jgi:RNA polymerase sigma-70 factor, ECF subfamily
LSLKLPGFKLRNRGSRIAWQKQVVCAIHNSKFSHCMSEPTHVHHEFLGRNDGLEAIFGFIPEVFTRQRELSQIVAAERALARSIVDSEGSLGIDEKIAILTAVARPPERHLAPRAGHYATAFAVPPALLKFAAKLSSFSALISHCDVDELRAAGLNESAVVEAVATVAVGQFFMSLASGFAIEPASIAGVLGEPETEALPEYIPPTKPYIQNSPQEPLGLKSAYSSLREQFGFVPGLYRIQGVCPGIVKAEVEMLEAVLFPEDHLSRAQKELIILRLASLNSDSYLVTMHGQILSLFGMPAEECDQVIDNLRCAALPQVDKVLLEELSKLGLLFPRSGESLNRGRLEENSFTELQIVEGVVIAAFTNFLSTVQFGLGPVPDFPPRRTFDPKHLYLSRTKFRPKPSEFFIDDPDGALVDRVRNGETDAFADLVRHHSRRVFGTLLGILGNVDDARDSTQDAFLKAFQNMESFQGRSKFSTWLTSIAVNTGTELLRRRKPTESLDDCDDELGFRPRQIQSWVDNPEQQVAKAQMNELVRRGVLRLPEKYRVAVLLRDVNQVSTEEAAAALNLSIPALKARVLRGRLMLRESLAPHFSRPKGVADV